MASGQLELQLFGQKIRLKHKAASSEDPELVERIVKLVQKKVKEAEARAPVAAAPHHVAVIALLDLAAEYLQAKARTEDFKREVDLKSAALVAWAEKTFESET
jgi:cell division protein ZapA (FtsZ GTPase activity inhibitor)